MEKIFVMNVLNEDMVNSKYQAVKCEASLDADYLGLVLESKSISLIFLPPT